MSRENNRQLADTILTLVKSDPVQSIIHKRRLTQLVRSLFLMTLIVVIFSWLAHHIYDVKRAYHREMDRHRLEVYHQLISTLNTYNRCTQELNHLSKKNLLLADKQRMAQLRFDCMKYSHQFDAYLLTVPAYFTMTEDLQKDLDETVDRKNPDAIDAHSRALAAKFLTEMEHEIHDIG